MAPQEDDRGRNENQDGRQQADGRDSWIPDRRSSAINEDSRRRDTGHESEDRTDQEIAKPDVRSSSDKVDHRKRRDGDQAHNRHRQYAPAAELDAQAVQAGSRDTSHGIAAQPPADPVAHGSAERRTSHGVGGADERTERDHYHCVEQRDRKNDQSRHYIYA